MVKDSAMTVIDGEITTKYNAVQDFYFNRSNDPTLPSFAEKIDLNFYYTQKSPVAYPDSAVCDMWGIVRKFIKNNYADPLTGFTQQTFYVDSTRIGIFPEASKLYVVPLDTFFTRLLLYDGIRIIYSNYLNDRDTLRTYFNIRFKR
jgi:hypothetical protein